MSALSQDTPDQTIDNITIRIIQLESRVTAAIDELQERKNEAKQRKLAYELRVKCRKTKVKEIQDTIQLLLRTLRPLTREFSDPDDAININLNYEISQYRSQIDVLEAYRVREQHAYQLNSLAFADETNDKSAVLREVWSELCNACRERKALGGPGMSSMSRWFELGAGGW